jgi:formamidopyrimidine-DNA glycosylase
MPELPEVETLRRQLAAEVVGRTWSRVEARPSSLLRTPAREVAARLTGARLERVERRGKVLLLGFGGDRTLLAHFGMSGQVLLAPPAALPPDHRHLVAELDDGRLLVFRDPRRFGYLRLVRGADLAGARELAGLGRDPLDHALTWQAFLAGPWTRGGAIKALLLNQAVFAGIGNVYADEILFAARVRPTRPASALSPAERKELYHAIRDVLARAVELGGTSFDEAFVDLYGRPGLYGARLAVYGREGEPCPRCHAVVRGARVNGRVSAFCPRCQK